MYPRAQRLIANSFQPSGLLFSPFSAFRFSLERSSYTVVESDGVVTVCVTADRGDGSEVYSASLLTINITTQGSYIMMFTEKQSNLFICRRSNYTSVLHK